MPDGPDYSRRLDDRAELAKVFAAEYRNGASIRDLSLDHHVSYTTARQLVLDGGAKMRSRGGNYRLGPEERRRQSIRIEENW